MPVDSPITFAPSSLNNLEGWLHTLGLASNPFDTRFLDAGADPELSSYLVGHEAFEAIAKEQQTLIFAPVGGGKSSFRVRLAQACRVGQHGRRIFAVVYKLPEPWRLEEQASALAQHYRMIVQGMAYELLLRLLYQPERLGEMQPAQRQAIAQTLQHHLPINASILLEQIAAAGSIAPLLALYDQTASHLPGQASPEAVRTLCAELGSLLPSRGPIGEAEAMVSTQEHFAAFVKLIKQSLHYEAIYLLVDGVDAYVETVENQRRAVKLLEPLFKETSLLDERIFFKFFVPSELQPEVTAARLLRYGGILEVGLVDIHWTRALLSELIATRLRLASRGRFDHLAAISTPDLRDIHEKLIDAVASSPRELLVLAERVLIEHMCRSPDSERLEQEDVTRALAWYKTGSRL